MNQTGNPHIIIDNELIKGEALISIKNNNNIISLVQTIEELEKYNSNLEKDQGKLHNQLGVYQRKFGPLTKCDCKDRIPKQFYGIHESCNICDGAGYYLKENEPE